MLLFKFVTNAEFASVRIESYSSFVSTLVDSPVGFVDVDLGTLISRYAGLSFIVGETSD